ncbi:hypothetical protein K435DRAFT_868637 [Dendrothele bispora CBS 962.96]|uniref:DUF6532 domain-containing protein n=1 Tax=Dendrothele bispora (strain CBS 962.96) TaxID=1314807 RepID=A0A4V4HD71_DENBC|nr:hypothetical protein K435DRAFT_868637 [Dendrothele bispora CBS 962.96]
MAKRKNTGISNQVGTNYEENQPSGPSPKRGRTINEDVHNETDDNISHRPVRQSTAMKQKQQQQAQHRNHVEKLARLEKQALALKQKLKVSQVNDKSSGEEEDGSDDDMAESEEETGHGACFIPSSMITAMPTVKGPAPPRIDFAQIHRRQNPATSKTPRNAFLSQTSGSASEDESLPTRIPIQRSSPIPMPPETSAPAPDSPPRLSRNMPSHQAPEAARITGSSAPPAQLSFSDNYRPGGKPKASDYDSEGEAILLRAASYYESKIIGVQPFPSRSTQVGWANKAFLDACRVAKKNFECNERINTLIRSRGSRARGDTLSHVLAAVNTTYGFRSFTNKKDREHNLSLYNRLMEGDIAFAHKDVDTCERFGENAIFQHILRAVCFNNGSQSCGIVFAKFFNPVSLQTIAFFMTQIKYVLQQYKTGVHIKPPKGSEGFTEVGNNKIYEDYLKIVNVWSECEEKVVLGIRKKMYTKARERSGIDPPKDKLKITPAVRLRMMSQLTGRTGETDSEEEPESDDEQLNRQDNEQQTSANGNTD